MENLDNVILVMEGQGQEEDIRDAGHGSRGGDDRRRGGKGRRLEDGDRGCCRMDDRSGGDGG